MQSIHEAGAAHTRPLRILVIGGGVAGPALALFLRRAGLTPVVYEAHPYVEGVGGALAIAPNGMKVLAALGVANDLAARATTISDYAFRNDRGAVLAHASIDAADNGQPMVAMSRALLFQSLAARMREQGVEIHYGKRFVRVEERPTSVAVHFDDGSSDEGDVLVGADGVRSAVRQYLLPHADAEYTGLIGIGGFTPLESLPGFLTTTMTFVFGRRGFFGYSGADNGIAMWWSNLFRDNEFSREELAAVDATVLKQELLARFGGYHQPIPSLIANSTNLLQLNVHDVRSLPTWHRGRVVLIGDAAHAVSPSAGQGASLALEDAMYLAKLLRDASYDVAFARFECDRKPRAEKVVAEGRRRGGDKSIVGPIQQSIRELMIRLMVPLFGRKGDQWLYQYEIAW